MHRHRLRARSLRRDGQVLDSEALAYFTRAGIVNGPWQVAASALIAGIIQDWNAASFADCFDCFWILTTDEPAQSLFNAARPDFDLTDIGSTSFIARRGRCSNGATSYLAADYNPVADAIVTQANSRSVFLYITEGSGDADSMSVSFAGNADYMGAAVLGGIDLHFNGARWVAVTPNPRTGSYAFSRKAAGTGSANVEFYRDGGIAGAGSRSLGAGNPFPSGAVNLLRWTQGGYYSLDRLGVVAIGRGASDAEMAALHERVASFVAAVAP
jgi:hypothetical protein